MSTITFDPAEAPRTELDTPQLTRRPSSSPDPERLGAAVHLPMAISVTANAIFLVVFWVPEIGAFPTRDAWLTQLAPLVSEELTSAGQSVVASQEQRSGLLAAFFLLASLVLPWLARSRQWYLRVAGASVVFYGAVVGWVVTGLSLVGRGTLTASVLGMLLMTVWVTCAGLTVWRGIWLGPFAPRRVLKVPWPLVLYGLVGPLPLAVGRLLFAPELRNFAATELQAGSSTVRWAALADGSTVALYLAGLCVGLIVWAATRMRWVRMVSDRQVRSLWSEPEGRERGSASRSAALAGAALLLTLLGPLAHSSADQRLTTLHSSSPADSIRFPCGSWVDRGQAPARTLTLEGSGCRKVTAFAGYRSVVSTLEQSAAPVVVDTAAGTPIQGRTVSASFRSSVVVATTDREDEQASQLLGLGLADGRVLWRFGCDEGRIASLRFAAMGPDEPATGRITLPGEKPAVVVGCDVGAIALDPLTGKSLS